MKHLPDILRLLAIINYSDNRKNISYTTIEEYLAKNDVEIDKDFVELVNALDRALRFLVQNQEISDEALEPELKKELGSLPKSVVTNILQFWQREKHSIYDMIQKKNSQTAKLDQIKWSVNLHTYGKQAKNMREPSCILNLEVSDYKKPTKLIFELNKQELDEFCEELDAIESQLNDIFTGGEEAEQ